MRNQEREECIHTFVALRENRANLMKEYLLYENFIETIEGPAWYVELKAYYKKSQIAYRQVIETFGTSLTDHFQSSSHIRASCYSSGLFICLLLDDISPNWRDHYFDYKDSLFEFIKQQYSALKKPAIENVTISEKTEAIVEFVTKNKESEFEQFAAKPGFHLYIEGPISVKFFDPMNIVFLKYRFLHKNFIKVAIGSREYHFQQPVVAYTTDDFREIERLHLILNEKPVINKDSIIIDGVGELKGIYREQENLLNVYD